MNQALNFADIIHRFRTAGKDTPEADAMELAFDANTREWAEMVIAFHMDEYGIHPRNKSHLWEIAKNANLDILETVEVELAMIKDFMFFYIEFIHVSLLSAYFSCKPRLAEIIRKNVKHDLFTNRILPELKAGRISNRAGRKIQERSYTPPVYDAWTETREADYPRTFEFLYGLNDEHEAHSPGRDAAAAASGSSASDSPARTDTGITAALRREITQRLEEKTAGDWDYDREPFDNPAEETGRFFRTTLNWFIMNMMADSGEYSGRLGRLVSDLEKKERYNRAAGAVDEEMLSKLIRAFESGSPSGFYTEKNVGVKGRNLGMLFDRISNHAYNRLLFPELAQFAPPGWGIEE